VRKPFNGFVSVISYSDQVNLPAIAQNALRHGNRQSAPACQNPDTAHAVRSAHCLRFVVGWQNAVAGANFC
jgi:hypothetical protein